MKMDHALQLAASQVARPGEILAVAGRLSGQGSWAPLRAAAAPPPVVCPPSGQPDNLGTLRACQGLLTRTIALLE